MKTRKMIAIVVTTAMLFSLTGCNEKTEEVLDAADAFATNVCSLKAGKVASAVADIEDDTAEALEYIFSSIKSDDVLSAIASTFTYELDESSVELNSKKGEASVDVVFTYVDAASVYEDIIRSNGNEEDFIEALGDSDDIIEVETTIELTREDDKWLIDDPELECIEDLFAFLDEEFTFGPSFTEVYEGHVWWMADDENCYTNTPYIDFWGTYDASELTEEPELYFTVEHNSELVYTSDISSSADCYFYASDYTGEDILPAGTYNVGLFLSTGELVDFDSCTVYVEEVVPDDIIIDDGIDTETYFSDPESDWANTIEAWGWYNYNINDVGDGFYSTSDTIEYDLVTFEEDAEPLFFAYYYLADGTISSIDYFNPDCSGMVSYTSYSNGNFYEFVLEEPTPGIYLFVVAESADQWANGYGSYLCYSICSVS